MEAWQLFSAEDRRRVDAGSGDGLGARGYDRHEQGAHHSAEKGQRRNANLVGELPGGHQSATSQASGVPTRNAMPTIRTYSLFNRATMLVTQHGDL